MAYYITGDCHANFEKLIWLARFNKKLGKEDVIILYKVGMGRLPINLSFLCAKLSSFLLCCNIFMLIPLFILCKRLHRNYLIYVNEF